MVFGGDLDAVAATLSLEIFIFAFARILLRVSDCVVQVAFVDVDSLNACHTV